MTINRLPVVATLTVLALAATSLSAFAQGPGGPGGRGGRGPGGGGRRGGGLPLPALAEMNLTTEQKAKLFDLQVKLAKQRQGMRDLSEDQQREKMQAAMQETQKALQGILTPEQLKKLQAARGAQRGGPGGRRP